MTTEVAAPPIPAPTGAEAPFPWDPRRIRRLRKKLGWVQATFAEHLGVSYACVQAWERRLEGTRPGPANERALAHLTRQVVAEPPHRPTPIAT